MKSYVLIQNYRSPYVIATGHPRNPQAVMFKNFKKGDIVKGELKHANNKPAFVLVKGTLVLPLSVVKEVTAKDVENSDFSGESKSEESTEKKLVPNKKLKYIDSIVIGGIVGFGAVYLAETQSWLPEGADSKKFRMYGAVAGALIGAYLVFRNDNKVEVKTKTNE